MTITVQFDGTRAHLLEDGDEVSPERGLAITRALAETYPPAHFVYVAYSPARGAYKVGHSEKPHERVRALKAELVYSRECPSYADVRRAQAALVAEIVRCGHIVEDEWYSLPAAALADILKRGL